jgi:hypothetical protein
MESADQVAPLKKPRRVSVQKKKRRSGPDIDVVNARSASEVHKFVIGIEHGTWDTERKATGAV